ncbi:TPA: hypothetical protein ACH3X2_008531 [Trebouxia sp. C0005]
MASFLHAAFMYPSEVEPNQSRSGKQWLIRRDCFTILYSLELTNNHLSGPLWLTISWHFPVLENACAAPNTGDRASLMMLDLAVFTVKVFFSALMKASDI